MEPRTVEASTPPHAYEAVSTALPRRERRSFRDWLLDLSAVATVVGVAIQVKDRVFPDLELLPGNLAPRATIRWFGLKAGVKINLKAADRRVVVCRRHFTFSDAHGVICSYSGFSGGPEGLNAVYATCDLAMWTEQDNECVNLAADDISGIAQVIFDHKERVYNSMAGKDSIDPEGYPTGYPYIYFRNIRGGKCHYDGRKFAMSSSKAIIARNVEIALEGLARQVSA